MEIVKFIDEVVGMEGDRPVVMSYSWEDNDNYENELNATLKNHYGFKSPIFWKNKKSIFVLGRHDMLTFKQPFRSCEVVCDYPRTTILICRTKLQKDFPEQLKLDEIDQERQTLTYKQITGFEVYILEPKE